MLKTSDLRNDLVANHGFSHEVATEVCDAVEAWMEADNLQSELTEFGLVIRALVHRSGGFVNIARHELESAPSILHSFTTPMERTLMLSTQA